MNGVGRSVSFLSRGDQYKLAGTLYKATKPRTPSASILLSSATAVKQTFYRHVAQKLASEGYDVLTYDYRGIGDSRPPTNLRGFDASMSDWVFKDMAGALDYIQEEIPTTDRLYMFGHSVGGQIAGLLPPELASNIDGMVTVSSQSGYWKLQGGEQKITVCFHVHVTLPLLSYVVGYMPWSWFTKSAQDLPQNAALQWSKWCRSPKYILDDTSLPLSRYDNFTCPILAYSIEDDKWGTSKSVDSMMLSAYKNVERRHLDPKEYGLPVLGHFGYFREESENVWNDAIEWLNKQP